MTERAISFVEAWLNDRIKSDVFHDEEGPDERNRYLAEQLISDAGSAGIPPNEIEEDYPDLTSVVAGAIEAAADPDAKRFARQEE